MGSKRAESLSPAVHLVQSALKIIVAIVGLIGFEDSFGSVRAAHNALVGQQVVLQPDEAN